MEGEACNHDCEVSMGETPIPSQPGVYAKILSQGKKKNKRSCSWPGFGDQAESQSVKALAKELHQVESTSVYPPQIRS